MDGYSISEVDWGVHDSNYFLYLVHIDPDAMPKNFFTKEMGLNYVEGKLVHHLALQKGPNRLDHLLEKQWDPTQSLDNLLSSSNPDMITIHLYPSPCTSSTIIVLLVGHSYYLLKKMGRDLTSTSLMEYMKYSFDTEDEFSSPKSIKQYRSPYSLHDLEQHESSYNLLNQWDPGEKPLQPLQPQLFRKALATKIICFLWIESEYNLSCMLSMHSVLTKIFPMIQKLLMTCGHISLIPRSVT